MRVYALCFTFVALRIQHGTLIGTMPLIHWRHGFGTFDCALSTVVAIIGLIYLTFAWQDDRQDSISRGSLSSL
jgi:hypothetical protein